MPNPVAGGGNGRLINGTNGNQITADLLLAPLGTHRGATQTMALLPGCYPDILNDNFDLFADAFLFPDEAAGDVTPALREPADVA